MSTISMLRDGLRGAGVVAITVIFCAPALAGEIYSWRTEDGGYAYTDDAKAIPPRYRAQVASRESDGLGNYKRLTSPSPGSTDAYAQRLANRLEHLRTLNRDYDLASARPEYESQVGSIEVNTGSLNVGVPVDDDSDAPVVIETIRFRHEGEMATRHNLVVKKGDRILTVIKGKPLVSDINQAPEISRMVAD
jgi:hypothetical protein